MPEIRARSGDGEEDRVSAAIACGGDGERKEKLMLLKKAGKGSNRGVVVWRWEMEGKRGR